MGKSCLMADERLLIIGSRLSVIDYSRQLGFIVIVKI